MTHMLMGAVLGRAGFNRKASYATAAMAIAAELPDIDTIWSAGGPVVGFEHHRGITHTLLAVPVEAALVVAAFWAWRRWRRSDAVWNGWWLFAGVVVALLSHLLLDWTNNYGLRPLFPFDPRWFAGSFVFIVEPMMYLLLGGALLMPWLFGLINAEVGARSRDFVGRGWAWAGLVSVLALYGLRWSEHAKALQLTAQNAPAESAHYFASPYPFNPFAWAVVSEQPASYQLGYADTWRGTVSQAVPADTIFKPETTLASLAAKRTFLGRVYLDWSSWPVLSELKQTDEAGHMLTSIRFADARFMYNVSSMHGREQPPIGGTVVLDMGAPEGQRVQEMSMGGRIQR